MFNQIIFLIVGFLSLSVWSGSLYSAERAFFSGKSADEPIHFEKVDQGLVQFYMERLPIDWWRGEFGQLRMFAEKAIFGTSSGSLISAEKADALVLKSVFKVDQPFDRWAQGKFKEASTQNELFGPIHFSGCNRFKCLARQKIHALGFQLDVSYQNYYRFRRIDSLAELGRLGFNSKVIVNTTEFPKYVMIQAGKNWSNCFEDTVSVTFFEKHPQTDAMTLVHSYQVLSLTLFGSLPQAVSVIQTTIQQQIQGFIRVFSPSVESL